MDFSGHERRKYVRVPKPLNADYRIFPKDDTQPASPWKSCSSNNISLGGICIQIPELMDADIKQLTDKNNIFEMKVCFPDDKEMIAKGSINYFTIIGKSVWNHVKGKTLELGLKFLELDAESEKLISDYIIQRYLDNYGTK